MTSKPASPPQEPQFYGLFARVSQWLLLVPEGLLLIVLLCAYLAFGVAAAVPLVALLTCSFLIRTAALHLARRALDAGRYREAGALIQLALVLHPWSADGHALRGTLAMAIGQAEVAEAALRRAVELLPRQAAFQAALSGALLECGRSVEAAHRARLAIQIAPEYAIAYLYLAEAERANGAAAEMVEARLRSGLEIAQLPEAVAALSCALAAHLFGERRFAEAMLALRSAEAMLPRCGAAHQAQVHYLLAELLTAQGQLDRAREHFQGVEALDPQGRFATAAWRGARL